jgi:hypothetical protein
VARTSQAAEAPDGSSAATPTLHRCPVAASGCIQTIQSSISSLSANAAVRQLGSGRRGAGVSEAVGRYYSFLFRPPWRGQPPLGLGSPLHVFPHRKGTLLPSLPSVSATSSTECRGRRKKKLNFACCSRVCCARPVAERSSCSTRVFYNCWRNWSGTFSRLASWFSLLLNNIAGPSDAEVLRSLQPPWIHFGFFLLFFMSFPWPTCNCDLLVGSFLLRNSIPPWETSEGFKVPSAGRIHSHPVLQNVPQGHQSCSPANKPSIYSF